MGAKDEERFVHVVADRAGGLFDRERRPYVSDPVVCKAEEEVPSIAQTPTGLTPRTLCRHPTPRRPRARPTPPEKIRLQAGPGLMGAIAPQIQAQVE